MLRYIYTFFKTLTHYSCLRQLKRNKIETLHQLTQKTLNQKNVACLVLDFDGVLNAHAEPLPHPDCQAWLKTLTQTWPQENIVILSNKPEPRRIQYFKENFPGIDFCKGIAKKPYPDGLLKIAKDKNITSESLLLVDDRLLTGMLACCLSGAQGLLVQKPFKRLLRRPIRETFFIALRTFERLIII